MASCVFRFCSSFKQMYSFEGYFSVSLKKFSCNCNPRKVRGPTDQCVRYYSRKGWFRKPLKVMMPGKEGRDEMEDAVIDRKNEAQIHEYSVEGSSNTVDNPSVPHYIKLKENTDLFVSIVTLAKSRKQREKKGKILLEGKRLIRDALDAGIKVDSMFFSEEEILQDLPLSNIPNLKLYKVMYKDLSIWSDLSTSPGIIGVFQRPDYSETKPKMSIVFPLTVICDNIRDPGNLGAILRCVAAAGCKKILLTKGCVDLWEPKVLRAGCGAHFHIASHNNIGWEFVGNYLDDDSEVYLASNGNESVPQLQASSSDSNSRDRRRRTWYEVTEDGQIIDPSYTDKDKLMTFEHFPIKQLPYFDVKFVEIKKELVLIIGGETEGVSSAAYKFAMDRGGQLLFIPMANNVESLNSAMALSIIMFEIQRQFRNACLNTRSIQRNSTSKS